MKREVADQGIQTAMSVFAESWERISDRSGIPRGANDYLQAHYIENNPNEIGFKDVLDDAGDGSEYSVAHARYHPQLRDLAQTRGYYDIFLFDTSGNLVYSVFKDRDFATGIGDGVWGDTGLGEVFLKTNMSQVGDITFADFSPYASSHGVPAAFCAMPIFCRG